MVLCVPHPINDLDAPVPMRFPDPPIIPASLAPSIRFNVPHPMKSYALLASPPTGESHATYIRLPRHATIADHSPLVVLPYPQIVAVNEPLALLLFPQMVAACDPLA